MLHEVAASDLDLTTIVNPARKMLKSLGDAIQVRNHLIAHLEEGDSDCCEKKMESLLTFVVAGGGFAGVETVAGINDFVRRALRSYPHLSEDMVRVILIHSGQLSCRPSIPEI